MRCFRSRTVDVTGKSMRSISFPEGLLTSTNIEREHGTSL